MLFGDHPAFQDLARGSYVEASQLCFRPQERRDVLCRLMPHLAALAEF